MGYQMSITSSEVYGQTKYSQTSMAQKNLWDYENLF